MIRAEHKYMLLLARADGLNFGPRSPSSEYITARYLLSELQCSSEQTHPYSFPLPIPLSSLLY
jgi:hypothetical protein